jgi:NAD(P)-dependent dehydrogenase (short-subunit alcohol dehydrogenase family)
MAAAAGVEIGIVQMDIGDDESVRRGFAEIGERAGHVDVIVNNAGVGGNAVTEECSAATYLEVMNVDLCGAVRCIQAVLPQMRRRGSGCIVNISSVAGRIAALAQSPYSAAKWALEAVSEGLAQEVAPFGIRVAIIEPGVTRSAIFAKNVDLPNESGAYDDQYRRMFQFYATGLANATDPFEVAAVIHHAITTDAPKLRYPVSWGGQAIVDARQRMSDEDWVELGRAADDEQYYAGFEAAFGLDLRPTA